MSVVRGENVIVLTWDGAQWRPYACGVSCTFTLTTDFVETSVKGTGVFATFKPSKNSFTGSISGLTHLGVTNMFTLADLRAKQINQELLLMRFTRTSESGHVYTEEVNFYISSSSDDGAINTMNNFNIELKGTGGITQVFTPTPIIRGKVKRFEHTGIGGEVKFIVPDLNGRPIEDVLYVDKDGIGNAKLITTGTPIGKEVKFFPVGGELEFASEFEAGEMAVVLYNE